MRFGIRDNLAFNRAMLAKQVWRLLNCGDSAIARTLRARYYPHISFLDARAVHNTSFTWKSILVGKDLLQEGIIWRIGDGQKVRI